MITQGKKRFGIMIRSDWGDMAAPVKVAPDTATLIGGMDLITDSPKISIRFSYPLNNPVEFEFENKYGFTRFDIYQCIHNGYSRIYKEEDESKGKYGIWGHYIGDLVIERVTESKPNFFELNIGS